MTVAQNTVDRLNRNQTAVQVVVTTNLTVNQGDLLYWDGTNFTATPVTASNLLNGSNFLGAALQSNAGLIYPGDPNQPGVLILARGTVFMNTTAGDIYQPFTPVTVGADAQTITAAGVTTNNRVGVVVLDAPFTPRAQAATPVPEQITGAAGQRIRIAVTPNHVYTAAI